MHLPRATPYVLLALVAAFHLWAIFAFHSLDGRLPDGDVMGHLGAIESHRYVIDHQGLWAAISGAFTSEADYPPLHTLLTAMVMGPAEARTAPFPAGVEAVSAAVWLLTLTGVFALGRRHEGPWAGLLAAALWSVCPLALAVGRTPMPEPWAALWLVLTALTLEYSHGLRRYGPTALAALTTAAGLLTKQTFALYVALPIAAAALSGLRRPGSRQRSLKGMSIFLALALPLPLVWLGLHIDAQGAYLGASAGNRSGVPLWHHGVYYPLVLVGQALGPFVTAAALAIPAAAALKGRGGRQKGGMGPLRISWLGTAALLTLIPKKYPRLVLPLLPLIAVDAAVSMVRLSRRLNGAAARWAFGGVALALIGLGGTQTVAVGPGSPHIPPDFGIYYAPLTQRLDPGCLQAWLRPAHPGDPRLGALFQAVEGALLPEDRPVEPPEEHGRLVLLSQPELGCDYQTTFPYVHHIPPYFRRRGREIGETPVANEDLEAATRLLSGPWVAVVASTSPWSCPSPPGAPDLCRFRSQYRALEPIPSGDPALPFTWYLYERRR